MLHLSSSSLFLALVLLTLSITVMTGAQAQTANNTTTTASPPSTTTDVTNITTTPPDDNVYGDGILLQPNTSLHLRENKCMVLNTQLRHSDLHVYGAEIRTPICIPTTATRIWKLANGTGTVNKLPTGDEIDNCVATCSMISTSQQKSATVTVIFAFGQCYCWDEDFHEPSTDTQAATTCCKDGFVYENYMLNAKCMNSMFANVFITSLLCPLNISFCSRTTLAKDHCESVPASVYNGNTGLTENFPCCVPEGSLDQAPSWGLQVAQYTIIIICVLALFQVLYWIFRKRRDTRDDDDDDSRRQEQPRLLIVPTSMSPSSSTTTPGSEARQPLETQTITQEGLGDTHAIAAAREVIKLYRLVRPADIDRLEGTGQEDCSVCIDPLKNSESVKTPCEHMFHKNCLFQYIAHKLRDRVRQVTCPVCRAVLVDASINEDSGANNNSNASSPSTSSPNRNASPSSSSRNRDNNPLTASLLTTQSRGNNNNNNNDDEVEMRSARGNRRGGNNNANSQLTPRGASALL